MAQTFAILREAKAEYKRRTGHPFEETHLHLSSIGIYNKRKAKWRTPKQRKALKKPYFVGSYMEYINHS